MSDNIDVSTTIAKLRSSPNIPKVDTITNFGTKDYFTVGFAVVYQAISTKTMQSTCQMLDTVITMAF
jgi:hypothetical protein